MKKSSLQTISMTKGKQNYFESNNFKLLLGDSFQILKKFEPKSVNFIFADPPYFLSSGGISCHAGKQVKVDKGEWDLTKSIKEKLQYHRKWISLCRNVLDDNGTIMISSTLHSVYAIGVALEMEGFSIINNIIWRKTNPAPNLACRCLTHSTETIIWARKQLTAKKKGKHYFDYQTMKGMNGGKQMKDVWDVECEPIFVELSTTSRKEKKLGKHPTQKPLALLERLLIMATKDGDVVLDPFNGSGTTGIVSFKLNRQYIGIDCDKNYLDLTIKRIKEVIENE